MDAETAVNIWVTYFIDFDNTQRIQIQSFPAIGVLLGVEFFGIALQSVNNLQRCLSTLSFGPQMLGIVDLKGVGTHLEAVLMRMPRRGRCSRAIIVSICWCRYIVATSLVESLMGSVRED